MPISRLGVLERSVPKALAFAFGPRLRSKTQHSKTRILDRMLSNEKPQERLRFRDFAWQNVSVKKAHCDY